MPTQPNLQRIRPAKAPVRLPRPRGTETEDLVILQLLAEQSAIPLDQLARFLDRPLGEVEAVVSEFEQWQWLESRRFVNGDPAWVWLRSAGAALCGVRGLPRPPTVRSLIHRRAINEVRLDLTQRAPRGRWRSERVLWSTRQPGENVPDAIFEIGDERHAIEVELTPKSKARLRRVITEHFARYDAVIYFCSKAVRRVLERMPDLTDNPKLIVRELPLASGELACLRWRSGERDSAPAGRRRRPLEPFESRVLNLISEQGAVPLDQLARFLSLGDAETGELVDRLHRARFIKRSRPLAGEPEWLWLNRTGARVCGTELQPPQPRVGGLEIARATNEARLYVEARSPEARWISRRALVHRHGRGLSLPRAAVAIGGERHAVEIELRNRSKAQTIERYAQRCRDFDAVIVFCPAWARARLERLASSQRWPNLLVRALPGLESQSRPAQGEGSPKCLPALAPLPPDSLPAAALLAIREASGLTRSPVVASVKYRHRRPLWRVETDQGVFRVAKSRFGWTAKPQPEMREIACSEVRAQELAAIQQAAGLATPPRVLSAQRRVGQGYPTLRVLTDGFGVWRVANNRWGWTAKQVGEFF